MLVRFTNPPTEITYSLLRIVAGLLFAFHGAQKIFGFHSAHQPAVGSQVWIGGIIELVCGLAIVGVIFVLILFKDIRGIFG